MASDGRESVEAKGARPSLNLRLAQGLWYKRVVMIPPDIEVEL
jgi:hypothetical protein